MITSLLIANRGEIAVRIIRTCRRLGIRAIAVYSDADRDACHVAAADEAIRIGPAAARDSYLRPEAIMDAASRTGADAVHPGYGFLSEKPVLPELCAAAGRIFVGPSADRITAMGGKISAKQLAARAGIPCVPGYTGGDQSTARLVEEAQRLGFPLMLKASAGGGGRGMRRVLAAAELLPALDIARQEAEAAFGDPTLLIERLVLHPRHLEVQVAGDKHGAVVHLFERDCSVQRNNQKLLEEAPAPNLSPAPRTRLLDRGVALARAIAYDNLGTVEFILEAGQEEPWFLEMNTRLQVEHPVTEAITGLDLVEWQIRIACGEPLPLTQPQITAQGHAIEARITAERAEQNFAPDSGSLAAYREPAGIRVDSGVTTGSDVTLFYDSLLAKAIGTGATREQARAALLAGLRDFTILGPATTLPFLIDAIAQPMFARGEATTRFIEIAFPNGWQPPHNHLQLARATACALAVQPDSGQKSAWTTLTGFRLLGVAETRLLVAGEGTTVVTALPDGSRSVRGNHGELVLLLRTAGQEFETQHGDRLFTGSFHRTGPKIRLTLAGELHEFIITPEQTAASAGMSPTSGSGTVLTSMPGVIAEIKVAVGDTVEAGQVVFVLESMKTFAAHAAGIDGVVIDIACRPGDTVPAGKPVVQIKSATDSPPPSPR